MFMSFRTNSGPGFPPSLQPHSRVKNITRHTLLQATKACINEACAKMRHAVNLCGNLAWVTKAHSFKKLRPEASELLSASPQACFSFKVGF